MSRTYRRKNEQWEYNWVCRDWDKIGYPLYWKMVQLEGKSRTKAINKFHSDAQRTMNQVPSWYVNQFCNRPFRAKMKHEVRMIMKRADDYEDYNFDPFKKDALWSWW